MSWWGVYVLCFTSSWWLVSMSVLHHSMCRVLHHSISHWWWLVSMSSASHVQDCLSVPVSGFTYVAADIHGVLCSCVAWHIEWCNTWQSWMCEARHTCIYIYTYMYVYKTQTHWVMQRTTYWGMQDTTQWVLQRKTHWVMLVSVSCFTHTWALHIQWCQSLCLATHEHCQPWMRAWHVEWCYSLYLATYGPFSDARLYVLLGVSHIQWCYSPCLCFTHSRLLVLMSCLTHVAPHIHGCKCLCYDILLLTLLAASAYVLLHTCCSARSWLPVLTVLSLAAHTDCFKSLYVALTHVASHLHRCQCLCSHCTSTYLEGAATGKQVGGVWRGLARSRADVAGTGRRPKCLRALATAREDLPVLW